MKAQVFQLMQWRSAIGLETVLPPAGVQVRS